MKIKICFSLVLLIAIVAAIILPGQVNAVHNGDFIPGEVIVMMYSSPSFKTEGNIVTCGVSGVDEVNKKFSATSMEPLYGSSEPGFYSSSSVSTMYKVTFSEKFDPIEVAEAYSSLSEVAFAQPNYLLYANREPDDPEYATEQKEYLGIMNCPAGWDIITGSSSIVIAVVDSGVDLYHPDLEANIWVNPGETPYDGIDNDGNGFIDDYNGYDFVSVSSDSVTTGEDPEPIDNNPDDFAGHGTFVASQASAVGNNALGITGVSWSCKIMPVRAGYQAPGQTNAIFSTGDVAAAIAYAADNNADIINMSFGTQGDPNSFPAITQSVQDALNKGLVVVAAAGNRNLGNSDFPGNIPGVLSVGSVNNDGSKSSFSNYGTDVDVYAIGNQVYGSYPQGPHSQTGAIPNKTGNANSSGTSFSSPITAGLAALILSADPSLTREQVTDQIVQLSDTTSGGYNMINVYRALTEGELGEKEVSYNLPSGWSLISFPLTSVTSISGFEGSFYYDEGRVGENAQEIAQSQLTQLEPGKAYWTYNPDGTARTATAKGMPLMNSSFSIQISSAGMIPVGNPFTFYDISWGSAGVNLGDGSNLTTAENMGATASTLYYYDTATRTFLPVLYESGTLERTKGYYIVNRSSTDLVFTR